jgi:hypothetical protein
MPACDSCVNFRSPKPQSNINYAMQFLFKILHHKMHTQTYRYSAFTGSVGRKPSLNCEECFEIVVLVRGGGRERRHRLQGQGLAQSGRDREPVLNISGQFEVVVGVGIGGAGGEVSVGGGGGGVVKVVRVSSGEHAGSPQGFHVLVQSVVVFAPGEIIFFLFFLFFFVFGARRHCVSSLRRGPLGFSGRFLEERLLRLLYQGVRHFPEFKTLDFLLTTSSFSVLTLTAV